MKKLKLCWLSISLIVGKRGEIANARWLPMCRLSLKIFQLSLKKLMKMENFCMLLNVDHGLQDKVCLKALSKILVIVIINGKFSIFRILVYHIKIIGILLGLTNLNLHRITKNGLSLHLTNGNKKTRKSLLITSNRTNKIGIGSNPINDKPHKVNDNSHHSGGLTINIVPCKKFTNKP